MEKNLRQWIVTACLGLLLMSCSLSLSLENFKSSITLPGQEPEESFAIQISSPELITPGDFTSYGWTIDFKNSPPLSGISLSDFDLSGEGSTNCFPYVHEVTPSLFQFSVTGCSTEGPIRFSLKEQLSNSSADPNAEVISKDAMIYTSPAIASFKHSTSKSFRSYTDSTVEFEVILDRPISGATIIKYEVIPMFTTVPWIDPNGGIITIPPQQTSAKILINVLGASSFSSEILQLAITSALSNKAPTIIGQQLTRHLVFDPSKDSYSSIATSPTGKNTCAITTGGELRCWGNSDHGQLGIDSLELSFHPKVVHHPNPARKFTNVAVSNDNACAIDDLNKLYCWGSYTYIRGLSSPDISPITTPLALHSSFLFLDIHFFNNSFCGIVATNSSDISGSLRCWHSNNTTLSSFAITDSFIANTISYNSSTGCGILEDQSIRCWGSNSSGQLGDGSKVTPANNVSVQVNDNSADNKYVKVLTQGSTTCGLTTNGVIKCWGLNFTPSAAPISTPSTFIDFSLSSNINYKSCAIDTDHNVHCWANIFRGIKTDFVDLKAISTYGNGNMICITDPDRALFCWGSDSFGSGQGPRQMHTLFTTDTKSYEDIFPIYMSYCAIDSEQKTHCVGAFKSLGYSATRYNYPVHIAYLDRFKSFSQGFDASFQCALDAHGRASCWNGYPANPHPISGLPKLSRVSSENSRACGIDALGGVTCWNSNGSSIVAIDSSNTYLQISSGNKHTCGLTTDHKVKCWGTNTSKTLGVDTNPPDSNTPVEVSFTDPHLNFKVVAAGYNHTCALTLEEENESSDLYCWGSHYGLATGNTSNQSVPQKVPGKYKEVAGGYEITCAKTDNDEAKCWGLYLGPNFASDQSTVPSVSLGDGIKFKKIIALRDGFCGITLGDQKIVCFGKVAPIGALPTPIPSPILGVAPPPN